MIFSSLLKWLGMPGIVGIAVYLFFTGVPLLNWWPVNKVPLVGVLVEGEISRRIEAHENERLAAAQVRAKRAAEELAERETERIDRQRRAIEIAAQARVNLATGEASEREAFYQKQAKNLSSRISDLEAQLAAANLKDPNVEFLYVEALKGNACPYPGDTKPSSSFLREYQGLGESGPN